MKKVGKFISSFITIVLFLNLIALAVLVISTKASGGEPQVLGYQIKTVLSGSMEPTFQTGSVIAVKPLDSDGRKSLEKGNIITFKESDGTLTTHRITKVIESGQNILYETKGDNNQTKDVDPVLAENVVAEYSGFTVPYVGYVADYAKSKNGSALMLIIPGVILIGYAAFSVLTVLRELDPKKNDKSKPA